LHITDLHQDSLLILMSQVSEKIGMNQRHMCTTI